MKRLIYSYSKPFSSCTSIEKSIQDNIYKMTLVNIPKYGWSNQAISMSSIQLGLSPLIGNGIFQKGIEDVLFKSIDQWNNELNDYYSKLINANTAFNSVDYLLSHSNIKEGIKKRLLLQSQFNPNWSQAVSIGIRPDNLYKTIGKLLDIVDIITQKHYLTPNIYKLIILKAYILTEMYILTDRSVDYNQTWRFLDEIVSVDIKVVKGLSLFNDNLNVGMRLILNSASLIVPYDLSLMKEIIELKMRKEKEEDEVVVGSNGDSHRI